MDTKIQNVEEAKKVIGQIISHQKSSSEKHSQIQKQVSDLTEAHRKLVEAQSTPKEIAVYGGDEKLRSYTDGERIQWNTEKKTQHIPGLGRVEVESPGLLDSTEPANDWHRETPQKQILDFSVISKRHLVSFCPQSKGYSRMIRVSVVSGSPINSELNFLNRLLLPAL